LGTRFVRRGLLSRAKAFVTGRGAPALALGYDTAAGAAAIFASLMIRYYFTDFGNPPGAVEFVAAALFAPVCVLVLVGFRIHRAIWSHTGARDIFRFFQAAVLAHLIFLPILFMLTRLEDFPRSTFAISLPLMLLLAMTPRLLATAIRRGGLRMLMNGESADAPLAVMVGARNSLDELLDAQLRREGGPAFRFRALVETGSGSGKRALHGVPLESGLDRLEPAARRLAGLAGKEPVRIVIADPEPDPALVNLAARVAGETGALLSRSRRSAAAALTSVEAADLLDRTPHSLSRHGARRLIAGKRVLVTGAGGAIGSELVRQAAALKPEKLILLDASETLLYEIDLQVSQLPEAPVWRPVLGDIRDRACLQKLFEAERPDVVLHAAALKHVPLMEQNAAETAMTNVLGTRNVVEAAAELDAHVSVVLISTDKAVDPCSVMGASKRAAELYFSHAGERYPQLKLTAVRFGNVLASSGSVVPLFERQIEAGGPVTVTHEEATRYFMTVEEAAGLVLEAGAQGNGGGQNGLFLLDMGEPVLIARLARQLIRLRGMKPGEDIRIDYTGLRPGEKLHESLAHAFEQAEPAGPEGVLRITTPPLDLSGMDAAFEDLYAAARERDEGRVRACLEDIVSLGWPKGVHVLKPQLSVSAS